jgi:hypothetical protein
MSGPAVVDSNNPVYLFGDSKITVTNSLNPSGGITAVITVPSGSDEDVVVGSTTPPYTLTQTDVDKFWYGDTGTPLDFDEGVGKIPSP